MRVQVALVSVHVSSLLFPKPCQHGKVARSSELLWFGRPLAVSQLGSGDEGITPDVRELQAEAYIALETLGTQMQVLTDQLRGFSPADRQYV